MQNLSIPAPAVHLDFPTPAIPADLADGADAPTLADQIWHALQNSEWDADEPTPLGLLDDSAPFDEDAPAPADHDIEALYDASRVYPDDLGGAWGGHPAFED